MSAASGIDDQEDCWRRDQREHQCPVRTEEEEAWQRSRRWEMHQYLLPSLGFNSCLVCERGLLDEVTIRTLI